MSLWGLWFTEQEEDSLPAAYNGVGRASMTAQDSIPSAGESGYYIAIPID